MEEIRPTQAALMLDVDPKTVRGWIEDGRLGGVIDESGKRRKFTTTKDAVEYFRLRHAKALDLAHYRGRSQRGAERTGRMAPATKPHADGDGVTVKHATQSAELPLTKATDKRLAAVEAQVRRLFATTAEQDKAARATNEALARLQAHVYRNDDGGPVSRLLKKALALCPDWL